MSVIYGQWSEERPARRWLAASALWHALVLGILFLPVWRSAQEPLPVIAAVLFEEPGSSGAAAAGAGGGGENASVTAEESRPAPPAEAVVQKAAPSPPVTEHAALPQRPKPETAPPPKPRAKPAPPVPVRHAETVLLPAQATPGPAKGKGMAASRHPQPGASSPATAGRGSEGTGQGALGEGAEGPGDEYFERLRRHLKRFQHWPEESGDDDSGTSFATFTIARDGTVRSATIERSSGYSALDQATLDMLRRASPVPPLPTGFRGDQITVTIPAEWKRGFFLRKLF